MERVVNDLDQDMVFVQIYGPAGYEEMRFFKWPTWDKMMENQVASLCEHRNPLRKDGNHCYPGSPGEFTSEGICCLQSGQDLSEG